jgi:hypothetical protein
MSSSDITCRLLSVDKAPAGSTLHAVAEVGVPPGRAIADAIGRGLGLPVVSLPADQAVDHFGWMGRFFRIDARAANSATRGLLGWSPAQPGLIADLDAGHYFTRTTPSTSSRGTSPTAVP